MNYKDPILKSKKKEAPEIDITDMTSETRNKILRMNGITTNIYNLKEVLPEIEESDIEWNITIAPRRKWYCAIDPEWEAQIRQHGWVMYSNSNLGCYRGKWVGASLSLTNGYIAKPVLWVDSNSIYTEMIYGIANTGDIVVIGNDGVPVTFTYTEKTDFTVREGGTVSGIDLQDVFSGHFSGSKFTVGNATGIVPGQRVVLYDNTNNAIRDPLITMDWHSSIINISEDQVISDRDDGKCTESSMLYASGWNYARLSAGTKATSLLARADDCDTCDRTEELMIIHCKLSVGTNTVDISAPINEFDRRLQYCAAIVTATRDLTTPSNWFDSGIKYNYNEATNQLAIDSETACDARISIYFRSYEYVQNASS